MLVSKKWLKELVTLKPSVDEVVDLLPLRTIGTKEVTDKFFELDMKGYNRADLLSMRGVAREIAAITDSEITFEDTPEKEFVWQGKNLPTTPVEIEKSELNPIQIIAKIEGLKMGKSEASWVEKLEDSGMRSVNNIVDVTNLIMLEYGQPLHSFDAASVKDETIIVRTAISGEELVTLDSKSRKLESSDIVLADSEKALDVGGVMGSKDTEVTEKTDTILLSGSLFNPKQVRATASRLGLHSEASKRFQHGLTPQGQLQAINAAIKMYESLGGKLTAFTIKGGATNNLQKIKLTQKKTDSLIGIKINPKDIEKYLTQLNFKINETSKGEWEVEVPYFRKDIEVEEDLIEEVARMYGYEKIPSEELKGKLPIKIDQSLFNLINTLKSSLVELGLTEIQSYSFYSSQVVDALGWNDSNKQYLVKITNPMSQETEFMRQNIWPNLVEVAVKNLRNGYDDLAIFEIGKVYSPGENRPQESYRLAITISNNTDNPMSELLTLVEKLGDYAKKEIAFDQSLSKVNPLFHPNRNVPLLFNGEIIGGMAEVHPRIVNQLGSEKRISVLEINLETLLN